MLAQLVVKPGKAAALAERDPRDKLGLPGKAEAREQLGALGAELGALQERLYAEGTRSVLLVLQGLDASGKTAPRSTSSPASILRGAASLRSRRRHRSSWRTTSSGACMRSARSGG